MQSTLMPLSFPFGRTRKKIKNKSMKEEERFSQTPRAAHVDREIASVIRLPLVPRPFPLEKETFPFFFPFNQPPPIGWRCLSFHLISISVQDKIIKYFATIF